MFAMKIKAHPCVAKPKGFTLVELAIVITIIGILIGGVLKGQQLIEQARAAATISQLNDFRTAYRIFQTTYDAIPGDMADPDQRIPGCTNCVADGTYPLGNRVVGEGGDGPSHPQQTKGLEPVRFWLQMSKAGVISGVSDAATVDGARKQAVSIVSVDGRRSGPVGACPKA